MAKHNINLGHQMWLQNTIVLARETRHMGWILREAIKIEFLPNNINREDGFSLSQAWKPSFVT
jgi:hypothetical protein